MGLEPDRYSYAAFIQGLSQAGQPEKCAAALFGSSACFLHTCLICVDVYTYPQAERGWLSWDVLDASLQATQPVADRCDNVHTVSCK